MNGIRTGESGPLVEPGLPLLRDLIHERTGLFYDNGRYDALSDRLAPLVIAARLPVVSRLLLPPEVRRAATAAEWRRVMDALSVQETYFWREIDQIQGLACSVLPALVARHGGSRPSASGACPARPARSR